MTDQISNIFYAAEALREVKIELDTLSARVGAVIQRIGINPVAQTTDGLVEAGDLLDYRKNRNPKGGLSEHGKAVMKKLIISGMPDKQVGERMGVTTAGVGFFRREVMKITKSGSK